jgi:hypothetical protein
VRASWGRGIAVGGKSHAFAGGSRQDVRGNRGACRPISGDGMPWRYT